MGESLRMRQCGEPGARVVPAGADRAERWGMEHQRLRTGLGKPNETTSSFHKCMGLCHGTIGLVTTPGRPQLQQLPSGGEEEGREEWAGREEHTACVVPRTTMVSPNRVSDKNGSRSLPWQGHRGEGARPSDGRPSKILPNPGEAAFPFLKVTLST